MDSQSEPEIGVDIHHEGGGKSGSKSNLAESPRMGFDEILAKEKQIKDASNIEMEFEGDNRGFGINLHKTELEKRGSFYWVDAAEGRQTIDGFGNDDEDFENL